MYNYFIFLMMMKQTIVYSLILLILLACGEGTSNKEGDTHQSEVLDSTEDSAMQSINEKIRKDINNPDLYLERSLIYEALGDNQAAVDDIDRALRIDSNYLNTLIAQVNFLLKRGDLNTTSNILSHAQRKHPEASIVYEKLSELYLIADNNKKALENADLAVKYDKYNAKAYYLKGYSFIQLGDTAKSISSFQTAAEQNPDYYEAYIQLGIIYASLDDPLALEYYNNALEVRPDNKEALYGIGMYQQEHEMLNEALETYTTLTKKHPEFREAYFNLGFIHMFYLKLYSQAKVHFTEAIEVDPNYFEAYYNRGYCHELLGDIGNAEKDFNKALTIRPDYTLAAQGLTRLKE